MSGPFLRRTSSSRNGGWPLFCRLLLWATRNNRACESHLETRPQAERVPAGALIEAGRLSKA